MSLFSNLFSKGRNKKLDIPITKLTPLLAKKPLPEKDSTQIRIPASPEKKDPEPWVAKNVPVWEPGDVVLDHYKIEYVITSGGMGLIYITNHQNWKVKIAIKSPTEEMLQDRDFFSQVQKEAEAWTELGLHPNIAYCYFVRNIEEVPHIFVEYVDGGNLKQWIEDGKCADLKTGLDLAIQFCHGMAHAHSKGMIHRDIKPANILMTQDGTLKVTDFGIAKWLRIDESGNLHERSGVDLGGKTTEYASPEQFIDEFNVGPETDIFSFGLCLWEMLCGKKPYDKAVVKEVIPNPRKLRHDLPESLHQLLEELVAFEKEERQKLGGFEGLRERFKTIYQELFDNKPSPHSELEKIDLEADGLNNRGVSYWEIGKKDEALKCFRKALEKDSIHPHATYNLSLIEWRNGQIDDAEVLRRLANCESNTSNKEIIKELTAYIHAERFDPESAEETLRDLPGRYQAMFSGNKPSHIKCIRTMEGHTDDVSSVVISPDNRYAISGSGDMTIKLWEIGTGRCIRTMEGHTGSVSSVAISPDGRYALSGSFDKTLKLWEIGTGRCIRTMEGHAGAVYSVAISPDSRYALSGSEDKTLKLWDLETGRCIRTIEGHTGSVSSVAISPDGRYALSGSNDNTLKLWEIEIGKCIRTMVGHTNYVRSVAISPDNRHALSGSLDMTLKFWEIETGKCIHTMEGHTDFVDSVAISPDGKHALSGSRDKTLKLWDLETDRCIRTMEGHTHWVASVTISPDSRYALSGSWDETLKLWEINYESGYTTELQPSEPKGFNIRREEEESLRRSISEAKTLFEKGDYKGSYSALYEQWKGIGFISKDDILEIYSMLSQKARRRGLGLHYCEKDFKGHTQNVTSVAISPDNRYALSGSVDRVDRTLKLWNIETGRCIRTMEGHTRSVHSVAITSDCRHVLSGSWDSTIKFWDLETGECIRTMKGHTDWVSSISVSPDNRYAISGSGDMTIKLWEIGTGRCIRTMEGHTSAVLSVAISPDNRHALSGGGNILSESSDNTLKLWDIETGMCIRTMEGHTNAVYSVAISPDNRYALSGSSDSTLKLWDLETVRCIQVMEGHADSVRSVAISPDSRYVLSGSNDNTLKLWEIETGRCIRTMEGHTRSVNSVAISPGNRYALSGSGDKALKLWCLIWDLEFPEPVDWDEGVRPYLVVFLTLHKGKWNEANFNKLIHELASMRGYGWVKPEGIRKELEKMTKEYKK